MTEPATSSGPTDEAAQTDRRTRARIVDRLLAVTSDLNAQADEAAVLERICRSCCELIESEAAAFIVERDGELVIAGAHGLSADAVGLILDHAHEDIQRQVTTAGLVIIPNIQATGFLGRAAQLATSDLHTAAVTAISSGNEVRGALCALFTQPDLIPDDDDIQLLKLLAATGGSALSNAEAYSALAAREAQEAAIIDSVTAGVAVIGPDNIVTAWNRSAEHLSGIERAEVIGQPLPFPVGDPERPTEHDLGDGRWLEIAATPLPDTDDRVVVLYDISRQKALEAAKSMFLASTSHELKTPLMAMGGFAQWLANQPRPVEDGDRHEAAVAGIIDGVDELSKLIETILLNARAEAGHLDLVPRLIDLSRGIPAVVEQFELVSNRIRLEVDVSTDLPDVIADGDSFQTILGQLIENAIKYSPDGGTIRITGRVIGPNSAEIAVADEGIGLSESEAEYLFMPFYQGESRRASGVRRGVGLGLAIVRRLAEANGGTVRATARAERGSVFAFTLPTTSDQDVPAPTTD